jgi:hypothetical protein
MHAFPRISVADARAVQGLTPRDEADVGGLRVGGEVAGEDDVRVTDADELFEEAASVWSSRSRSKSSCQFGT